ncbi:MAG: divergent polysaccharide deacetylase family protein [Desulfobacteraceae bacterium]|nr:MAG: divergent polysaccharide deacetylase family protein [Desulfobacteraceae bacterium]
MAKRKKRRIATRNKKKIFYLFVFICLIAGIFAFVFLKKTPKAPQKPPRVIAYEEVFPDHSTLNQGIGKIDQSIYRFLSDEKPLDKNIAYATLEPRQSQKQHWEFTKLGVKLKKVEDLELILPGFERVLTKLKADISFRKEVISEKNIVYHVFFNQFHTHKIVFFVEDKTELNISKLPKIAIIIDDLGYDPAILSDLEGIDFPLTLSVLPSAPYATEIRALVKRKGWELMVHIPMEPKNFPDVNPGAEALFTNMSDEEITELMENYLKEFPEIKGANNHMGSAFTENKAKMETVMAQLIKRKLYYIDSRTTRATVAAHVAAKLGVPTASRSVFLDNDLSMEAIHLQLERLQAIAKQNDEAIAIGHPHRQTITALIKYLPYLKDQVQIVHASAMVH